MKRDDRIHMYLEENKNTYLHINVPLVLMKLIQNKILIGTICSLLK